MAIKTGRWVLAAGAFWLSACTDDNPVAIQPGAFSEDWPTALRGELVKNNKCAIDQINGKTPQSKMTFKSGEALDMSGWVFSTADGAPPAVYMQLVGPALTYTAIAQDRSARPDVNQHFQLDPSWQAGFRLHATQNIEPSEYQLEILQPGDHGVARCKTDITITIAPASHER